MRLVIFGASGKVGRLAVEEALKRGHDVTAVVHRTNPFKQHQHLSVVQADIHLATEVEQAIHGNRAVLSTLGSWGTPSKDIVASATRNIIPAMQRQGIERIVTLTGTEAVAAGDRYDALRNVSHHIAGLVAGKILFDAEEHIRLLRASKLDWTALRSPVMTNGPDIFYRLTLQAAPPWQTITRKSVAKALLDQIDGPGYSQAAPFIYRQVSKF